MPPTGELGRIIEEQARACLNVYREDPDRIEEDAAIEVTAAEGGYGRKQLFELIQNAADALSESAGNIEVILTDKALYVANGGAPFTVTGAKTLLASHLSRKSGQEIGQFGLGFKSVTALSDHVVVASRTGSFEFDRSRSIRTIQAANLTSSRYPMLRLANAVDPAEIAASDPLMARLMEGASTVIKLALRSHRSLAADMAAFPATFLLFTPHLERMTLEDRTQSQTRSFRSRRAGDAVTITDNGVESEWIVERITHTPTKLALADAGELMRRSTVDVTWAVPRSSLNQTGEFWAYFPTGIRTTLAGIVNAPWKLSADRLAMVPGDYNEELLTKVLTGLVCRGLPRLAVPDDPVKPLDALPARGREARSWADGVINEPIYEAAVKVAGLPNRTGTMAPISGLQLHPPGLPQAWKEIWRTGDDAQWVHHGVDRTSERRAKAERLISAGKGGSAGPVAWLEACAAGDAADSAAALRLAAAMVETNRDYLADVRRARIVLMDDGTLERPEKGKIFLRSPGDRSTDHDFIHPTLALHPGTQEHLAVLGIEVLNTAGELRATLQQIREPNAWGRAWSLARQLDTEQAFLIFSEELEAPLTSTVQARTKSGRWRSLAMSLLAGEVIPADGRRDADHLIDPAFHAPDRRLLELCGAVSTPGLMDPALDEPWLAKYRSIRTAAYIKNNGAGQRLDPERVRIRGKGLMWPLQLLETLSSQGRVAMTHRILANPSYERWVAGYANANRPAASSIPNPVAVRVSEHGLIPTTVGPAQHGMCLSPDSSLPDCFPKAQVSSGWAAALRLPADTSDWDGETWTGFLRQTESHRPEVRTTVYLEAASAGEPAPDTILAQRSSAGTMRARPSEVAVTDEPDTFQRLLTATIPVLLLDDRDDVALLIEKWGLADGADMLHEETRAEPDGEPALLLDRFPPLRLYDREIPDLDDLTVQPCVSIAVLLSTPKGQEPRTAEFHRAGSVINVLNGTDTQILARVGAALKVGINAQSVLQQMAEQATSALRVAILAEDDLASKLVHAVGAEALSSRLPRTAIEDLERSKGAPLNAKELAELCLAVSGYLVLSEFRPELESNGLEPPRTWAGSRESRRFVEGLGFPTEYAGFAGARLSPALEVDGRVKLAPLHDYQQQVVQRITDLFERQGTDKRGMVTLPTGAGKTRVAVEACVRLATEGRFRGPILWVGQSEELCEQAVQAWAYVWRAIGSGAMTISRFWSGNEVSEAEPGTFQVVVATVDKLRAAIGKPQYEWYKGAALIIVDEAHTSIASSYTDILRWLGNEAMTSRMTTPLLGLTATAFRGHNEQETERLIRRYHSNKLDEGVFGDEEPYGYLQRHGVLARVQHRLLTGMSISLNADDAASLDRFKRLPSQVEERVGRDFERNQAILDSIIGQPDNWTTLLFATGVTHARALAAQLSYYGVPARPIDGSTDPALRRRYVDQFRAGDIRVLTNYNVLTQGFDAPKVQAVYVARPTFSPNLYQQMIGRGLRGPLNGGSEKVLIVNIEDNVAQYGSQLAFHHFDHLWAQER